jgi:putative transposase
VARPSRTAARSCSVACPMATASGRRRKAGSSWPTHPGAASSLREGLAETLTIGRLGVPPTLARTLRSTNAIESMIEICRDHAANVKRWRDGQMVLRWVAAGMGEARKQFRRVNGYLHLPALRAALDATIATVTPSKEDAAA